MAGRWEQTKTPGIYVQEGPRGKRYKAAYRTFSNGKPVVTSKTFTRIGQAQTFLADMRIKRATNTLPDVSKGARTVTDLWEHFEKTYRGKPSTFASYAHRWRNHIQPAFGKSRLDSLRRSGIEEFYEDLEARTSLDTRRKVQQILHKMLAVAIRSEWLVRNPADGIPMPGAAPERKPRVLTEDEISRLVDAVPSRYRALVLALADTGARPGELIALRVKNLNGAIRIVETTTEVHGKGQVTGTPKTRNSIRTVPMTPRLRAAIRDHFDAGYANRFDPESYVFPTEGGTQVRQPHLRARVIVPTAEQVGIGPMTTYDLRHSRITLWLSRGMSPWDVSKLTGISVQMIEKTYGHAIQSDLQEKIDRLGAEA